MSKLLRKSGQEVNLDNWIDLNWGGEKKGLDDLTGEEQAQIPAHLLAEANG